MRLPMSPTLLAVTRYLRWRSEHWSEDRLVRHQDRRIAKLLSFARNESPFYRDRLPAGPLTLDMAPRMTKSLMMEHFDEINTVGLQRDDLISFRIDQERSGRTDTYRNGFSIGLSSGTSGNKVLTVLSARERARYAMLLLARAGVPPQLREPRVLFALRTNNPAFVAVTAFGVELDYVDYFVPVQELVELINRRQINVVAGPPSLLVQLAAGAAGIHSRIETIISYAEELDQSARQRLVDAFSAPVRELYQGAEGMLGFTCVAGSLHLNEDMTFVELDEAQDPVGAAKRVVVTDLYRRSQPFIRYELNDLLEIGTRDCACGSAFRVISRIHGRSDSIFSLLTASGQEVKLMPDYVRRSINQASADIIEYQAVQYGPDDIEIRLVLAAGADRAVIEDTIISNLTHWADRAGGRLGAVRFSDLPPEPDPKSHKLVRVIRQSSR